MIYYLSVVFSTSDSLRYFNRFLENKQEGSFNVTALLTIYRYMKYGYVDARGMCKIKIKRHRRRETV